jgi:hypothetical protein
VGVFVIAFALQGTAQNAPATGSAPPAAAASPATRPFIEPPIGKPVFTDDFESGAINKDVWEIRQGIAEPKVELKVQSDKVAHGKFAPQATFPVGARQAYGFLNWKGPESMKKHAFGRAYMFIEHETLPQAHWVYAFGATAGHPTANMLEIGVYQNKWNLSYQQNAQGQRGETSYRTVPITTQKWICLEWELNDSPEEINLGLDGVHIDRTIPDLRGRGTPPRTGDNLVGEMVEFGVGLRYWGTVMEPYNVYYDDVAFGPERIGVIK